MPSHLINRRDGPPVRPSHSARPAVAPYQIIAFPIYEMTSTALPRRGSAVSAVIFWLLAFR